MNSSAQKTEKNVARLKLLNEVSANFQSLMDSENFYQTIVDTIQSKFDYYVSQFWSVEDDQATLRAQAGAYGEHLKIGHTLVRFQRAILSRVIETKTSYLSNDVTEDPNFTNLSFPVESKSQLTVPVIKDNEVIALLNIESDEKNSFDEEDVIALEALSSQLAVAIANRRIFQAAKDFNARLQKAVDEKTLELRKAHERILEQQKLLKRENTALKSLVQNDTKKNSDFIGNSPTIQSLLSMVTKIAPTQATVLIQGESGTGKELIARRLHLESDRSAQPYVTVNCGALQENLLESELFGHEKGSFTGAHQQKIGLVESADGGTLFLDEIGEMSLGIQAKLLRFLQEGEFYRIGGKRPIKVNVRVVSATNRDLETEVKENRFREDLFYRLNTITLRMPPLRKRQEDIPLLANHFLKTSSGGTSTRNWKVEPRVYEVLQSYHWPGNVRELQNTVERLKILVDSDLIRLEDIPYGIRMPHSPHEKEESNLDLSLEELEKSHILKSLAQNKGNKTRTAQKLGITIKTLYNKLHRYGILSSQASENRV